MPPGLAHALLALAIQAAVAVPIAFALRIDALAALLTGGVLALAIGAAFAGGAYFGRERRQSEEWYRSNRIPPWVWRPRAFRDMAWPALAVLAVVMLVGAGRAAWGHGAGFTAEENAWLERQRAVDTTKCCNDRDAHVGHAVDWRMVAGRYQVRIQGEWRDVPPGRLMQHNPADPTPWPGQALLFWSPSPHVPTGFHLWCFFPEPLT
jgi:hypothetical protein